MLTSVMVTTDFCFRYYFLITISTIFPVRIFCNVKLIFVVSWEGEGALRLTHGRCAGQDFVSGVKIQLKRSTRLNTLFATPSVEPKEGPIRAITSINCNT